MGRGHAAPIKAPAEMSKGLRKSGRERETMHMTHEGNAWHSVETVIDPSVKDEIRRWHVYLNGKFIGTKHTVTTYTDEGIRSGSITDVVGNEAYRAECNIRQQIMLDLSGEVLDAVDG